MTEKRPGRLAFMLAVTMMFWCGPAAAYVDPNATGLLFQILAPVATVAMAGLFFVRERMRRAWNAARRWAKSIL